jgi:hypothetical protein
MDEVNMTEVLNREANRNCLYGYWRGIDRADEAPSPPSSVRAVTQGAEKFS